MWPFRRKRDATPPSAGRADAGGPVHRSGPAAWRAAPPLQVVQTTRTTVDTGFVRHLATRADPSFLAPLGHHVVPGAPAGEVHNLVTPAPTPRTFAPPPGASAVQRIVASSNPVVESGAIRRPQRSLVDASEVELPPVPAPPSVRLERARPSSDRDVDLAEAAVADTGSVDEPAAVAPTLGADDAAAVAPANDAAATSPPVPTVSRRSDAPGSAAGRPRPRIGEPIDRHAIASTTSSTTPPVGGRPVQREPLTATVEPARHKQDRATSDPSTPQAALVGATPLGLQVGDDAGPPRDPVTTTHPPAMPEQPTLVPTPPTTTRPSPSTASATPPAPTVARSVTASGPVPTATTSAVQRRVDAPSVVPTLGRDPVNIAAADASTTHDEPAATPAGAATVPGEAHVAPTPKRPADPPSTPPATVAASRAPLVGSAQRTVTVLRELDAPSPYGATAPPASAAGPGAAAAQLPRHEGRRVTDAETTRPVQLAPLLGARAPVSVHRETSSPMAASDRAPHAAPSAAPAMAASNRPTSVPTNLSPPRSGERATASFGAGASDIVAVSRSVSMPPDVARLVTAASSPASTSTPSAPPERAVAPDTPAPDLAAATFVPPWVQREEDTAATGGAESASGATTNAGSSTIDAPAGTGTTPREPTEAEVDQLARAVYPQLRRQLSRDLLVDRERLGYRTDIRY